MIMNNLDMENLNKRFITICASCQSVKYKTKWLAYKIARLFIDIPKLEIEMCISHGICKECAIKLYGEKVRYIFDK